MAEIVRRRSWGGVLPLGRHVSISGSSFIQCASASIAPPHPGGAKCYPGAEVQGRTGSSLTQLGHRVLLSSWSDVDIREIQAHVALHLPLLQATLARWATGARIGRALTTLSVNRPPPGTRSSLVSCAQNAR